MIVEKRKKKKYIYIYIYIQRERERERERERGMIFATITKQVTKDSEIIATVKSKKA